MPESGVASGASAGTQNAVRAPGSSRSSVVLIIGAAVCFGTTGTAQALGASGASAVSLGAARIVFGGALLHEQFTVSIVAGLVLLAAGLAVLAVKPR
ncbi:hypothetical protein BH09ACT6_BH09ACT6_21770 [soil metagenome]